MAKLGEGLAGKLGIKRHENSKAYQAAWRELNREKYNKYSREYHQTKIKPDPEKIKSKLMAGTWTRRKRKYGLTKAEYMDMLDKQEGRCYICKDYHGCDLRVDHNHKTGKIRKLLCANCNSGLGMFKDSLEITTSAAKYLEAEG